MVQFCLNLCFTGVNILSGNLCFVIFFASVFASNGYNMRVAMGFHKFG